MPTRVIVRRQLPQTFGLHLHLYPQKRIALVNRIDPNTPGFFSGIKVGDSILSINGISMAGMSSEQIVSLLSSATTAVIEYDSAPAPTALASGVVIDLVDDDEEEPYRPTPPRQAESAFSGIMRPHRYLLSVERSVGGGGYGGRTEVIDLISSDEEDDHVERLMAEPAAPLPTPRSQPSSQQPSQQSVINSPSSVLTSSIPVTGTKRSFSSLGEAQSSASAKRRKDKGVMIKEEFAPKGFGEANIADEVVEVAPEELQQENNHGASCSASAANPSGNGHAMNMDEDFEIVGGNMTAASEMPHQREACTKHPFRNYMSANTRASIPTSVNLTFCLNCYCYVCEVKASECQDWPMHCNATYKMPQWKELQRANNAPILRIMTAEQKALYNSTYKSLLSSFLASSTGNYEDDDEDEYYSDSYDSYDDEDDYPHYGYGRFERHDQDDRYKGQVDAVVKQLRELLAESISDNNKFMAVVPLIATCMEKTKSRFRKYLEPVIIECMVHPFCNTDVLNVLRNIANAREMETIGDYLIAVQAFYANPSSKSVIGQLSVLPGNCIPNLFCRMCSKMSAEAQSTLIGMLRDLSQSWAVLMVLTNQAGSLPNENLDAFKGILYALCKKKEFTFMSMTADFARQYVIASDVSEQALLKLAAVMVDLLSTSSAALPISVVAYVFQLMLDMCMTKESAENISFLTQLASSEEHICTIRTLQTEVLHYISAQLDDNANKLVMCFSLLWLLVVRIYSSVPVDSMTNFLVPDWKLAIALRLSSFLHQSSRLGDAHSAVLLDIAQVAGAKALVHRDYPASACTLPSELINELCRLPRIGIAANDPTLQKYNIYLREFNGDSLSQVIPDLVCTVQNRTMLLQTLLHPSKMNRVVGHYLPCEQLCKLLRTQVLAWQSQHEEAAKVQAIIKSMDTVKFLWKSLVISMYQTVVNMQETYHKLFDRDLPTIDPPLIALVSDQQFIQQHGIEAMCVLFSLQVLKSSLVNTRPFLVYTQMKKNIDAVVSIWKLSTVAPKALSYIFMLDNLPKLDSLCVLVECLYKDLVHVHITKQYPQLGSMPVEKFLLNMAKEDWAACKAVSFGGCSNIFQLLGQVSIEEMAWAKELIEENMQQVVPLVETAAQIYIKDLSSCEVIIYSCINKANNLAFECYTRFSLAFTLTNASSARSLLASRLITLQAEFNHDQQQLERIQTKINSILSELPVGKEGFNGRAESTLCLCAYLGRIDICMARYGLDEAMMQAQFGSDLDKILNKVFCFCPGLTLEKAVSQLLPILRNRKHHSNTYIQHIERSVKHIKVPGRHDCARREVIFYHYQNCATLQELLRAVNNDEIVVNHIYSYMKNLSAPKSWSEYVKILYMLLGDERFAQHLYNWQLSPDIFVGSAIIIYDTVVQLLPSLASKEKVLVFVVNLIFYSNVNLITQCNNLQDIKAAWLDTGSTGDNFPEDVNSRIFFSKTLLMLLKDPQGAANYIATLRHYDALYAQYKEKILQNFMNVDKLEQSVEFHYHLQEYGTLFAYMNSLAFSVDVGRSSAIRFESLSKAVILLTNILTQDIYLNKHNIPLNVVSNDSFIRLLFNFCAHVVGYFYGVDTHNNYNAMLHTPLVKLITKVKDLSGGVQFVEDYLTCAMTQLSSYAPRLLQGLPNETLNSLLCCQPDGAQVSAPLGNAQTETVLMVMVRSIAKEGSIKCRLKLISVLLELKVNNSLGYLRSDNQFNLSVFRDLVNSLCREPSYSMTSSLFSPLALPRGIRTANNDGAVPKELVSILDQHKLEAAEVLEVPILIALLGLDQTELNAVMNIGSKLGTIMTNNTDPLWKKLQDGMIHQQLWQPVCKKMANLSPRLRYLSAFGDADKSILTVLGTGSAQLDVLSVKNTGAFPLYKAILKTMLISRCKTMYGQNPYGRNFCSPEDATILDILVRMCRDDKQGKETVLSTNEVLIILDSRGAYGGFLSSGHNMSSAAIEAMTAVPDLLNKFTSYLCSSIPAIALKRAECLIGLWRSMLQHAKGNSNNVVEALVSTLPSLAVGITSVTMSAANRQKLDILLNSFISMLGPYKVQYRDMISREVANASKIIKSKPKVVAEFRRVESSLIA